MLCVFFFFIVVLLWTGRMIFVILFSRTTQLRKNRIPRVFPCYKRFSGRGAPSETEISRYGLFGKPLGRAAKTMLPEALVVNSPSLTVHRREQTA